MASDECVLIVVILFIILRNVSFARLVNDATQGGSKLKPGLLATDFGSRVISDMYSQHQPVTVTRSFELAGRSKVGG